MRKQGKKPTVYVPTRAEMRLLDVLVNPSSLMMSVSGICRHAHINRDTYYEAFKRPEFREFYDCCLKEVKVVIFRHLAPMAHALVHEATRGSAPHLKMGLEIAGYFDKPEERLLVESGDAFRGPQKRHSVLST